jgi:hypothetical protein
MHCVSVRLVNMLGRHSCDTFRRLLGAAAAATILSVATAASADAPVAVTSVLTFEEQVVMPGAFAVSTTGLRGDRNTCSFPVTFSASRTRTDTTFDNGDVKIHSEVHATRAANGHTAAESDMFNAFIDHTDPSNWKVTGRFAQMFLDGDLIYLQSGKLNSPVRGAVDDPHPGPMGVLPNICGILSE